MSECRSSGHSAQIALTLWWPRGTVSKPHQMMLWYMATCFEWPAQRSVAQPLLAHPTFCVPARRLQPNSKANVTVRIHFQRCRSESGGGTAGDVMGFCASILMFKTWWCVSGPRRSWQAAPAPRWPRHLFGTAQCSAGSLPIQISCAATTPSHTHRDCLTTHAFC